MPAAKASKLDDGVLTAHCRKSLDGLPFLGKRARQLLEKLGEEAEKTKKQARADFLNAQPDLEDLWGQLLADAIHALKVRDTREKASKRGFPVDDQSRQATARDQNVYGITELREYFGSFAEFERVLYGSDDVYRDHVTHVIRVWLIGIYLLTKLGKVSELNVGLGDAALGKDPPGTGPVAEAREIASEERWGMWTVAALCHDLGYPLEKTHRINDVIDRMLAHFGNVSTSHYRYTFEAQHQSLIETTLRVIGSKVELREAPKGDTAADCSGTGAHTTCLQAKYHTKFAHSLEDFHHGIISCLVLMKTLVYFMETDYDAAGTQRLTLEDARQFHIRCEILRAMASHTCPDVYHLRIDTLPFLLILCDELQQWGRPTFRDLKLGAAGSPSGGTVEVTKCRLPTGTFGARVKYEGGSGPGQKTVVSKFRMYHKLMRAAIADNARQINFEWQIDGGGHIYVLRYDSAQEPFEELTYTEDGQPESLYKDKAH